MSSGPVAVSFDTAIASLSTVMLNRLLYSSVFEDNDEFRFNDASTHEGHLRQNGKLTWFCNETAIKVSYICIKCKTRTNLKIKAVRLC